MSIANVFFAISPDVLLISPDNSALCKVVSRHFKGNLVAGKDPDKILSQFSTDMSKNDCPVFQFYTEKRIGELFNNNTFEFNDICF